MDFIGRLDGYYYLIVVDSFSKWPEISKCKKMAMETVINFLYKLFAQFSIVDCIMSNNRTKFTSKEFKDFCWTFVVKHVAIAPYHSRSNGQVEPFVDMFKRALKKTKRTPTDTIFASLQSHSKKKKKMLHQI